MKKQYQSGFAMIEILVTALILAVGISGIGVLLLRSIQATQDTSQHSQAMWMVQDLVGRIQANTEDARAGAYAFVGTMDCDAPPATSCADTTTAVSTKCSSGQLATHDLWTTACGTDPDTFDSPADFVINPALTVQCTLYDDSRVSSYSANLDCIQYLVQIEWNTKLQQGGDTVAERDFRNIYTMLLELN